MSLPLFAVHISADVLSPWWTIGGFLVMAILIAMGTFRLEEDEIARVGVMTSALFIASFIHISLGPSSVHLLMNGVAGAILGRRVALAIPIGLLLQAVLAGHGSLTTWGINSCVMILPALLARPAFRFLVRGESLRLGEACMAVICLLFPWSLVVTVPLAAGGQQLRRRFRQTPAFEAGFVVGGATVLLTSILHSLVLALGGLEDWTIVALLSLAVHLPVAIVEGLIAGAMVDLIVHVKPQMLLQHAVNPTEKSHPTALPTAQDPR